MSNYNFHLDQIILKSTFKVFDDNSPYYNSFLSSTGKLTSCESHHHVETALEIIHEENELVKSRIRTYVGWINRSRAEIRKWERFKEKIGHPLGTLIMTEDIIPKGDYLWHYPKTINIEYCDKQIKEELDSIKVVQSTLKRVSEMLPLRNFKQANKNKGYDTAEFLILNMGYIAIENGYLLYNSRETYYTNALNKIGCYTEQDEEGKHIIIKKSQEILEQEYRAEVNYLKSQRSYYQESKNRFHCPSGFERQGYIRWRERCQQLGLNYLIQ